MKLAPHLPVAALLLAASAALFACSRAPSPPTSAPPALDSERARASYVVGLDMAKTLAPVREDVDIEVVLQAVRAAYDGRPSPIDEPAAQRIRAQLSQRLRDRHDAAQRELAKKNLQAGDDFLAGNGKQPGVRSTASGLQYQVLKDAQGPKPNAQDTVRVNYIGARLDGAKFESTYDTDHPAELVLSQVMPGWSEGVRLMPVGSRYRFWIPARLAYGERGVPGQIEPNATLVFEVELLEIAGRGAP
ncbi:FKBP-type peptidyl-prolyl cis-trans isomerase [Lysobacter silvisoli]|uniref:Peptidyl-prolyl cis-trans isomerase n=1 Tax=Lysobacter silvisoli TaxID=2293254 RepID=A0A371JWG5_9GAMM|nr:FKBP-type peptidyl-prolyl cis-trans isomerase [Lysobacter silvisoli]RDZ25927.1 FKBP-type peptidyl-prolyl cis-trans isomerase [Lysobacter silvisoli]